MNEILDPRPILRPVQVRIQYPVWIMQVPGTIRGELRVGLILLLVSTAAVGATEGQDLRLVDSTSSAGDLELGAVEKLPLEPAQRAAVRQAGSAHGAERIHYLRLGRRAAFGRGREAPVGGSAVCLFDEAR